jgi:hypothetical protein
MKDIKISKPPWAMEFKHYNQMDKASYFLANFIWEHKEVLLKNQPDEVYLFSSAASFYSDKAFINSSTLRSPSKFIYTLPSVKSNVICDLLNWEGPVYTFVDESLDGSIESKAVRVWKVFFKESVDRVSVEIDFDENFNSEREVKV